MRVPVAPWPDSLCVRTGRKGIKLGTLKGMFKKVSAEFDAPLPQSVLAQFGDAPLEP